eukprot:6196999-Pleurochrysis_carterae.AAC.4
MQICTNRTRWTHGHTRTNARRLRCRHKRRLGHTRRYFYYCTPTSPHQRAHSDGQTQIIGELSWYTYIGTASSSIAVPKALAHTCACMHVHTHETVSFVFMISAALTRSPRWRLRSPPPSLPLPLLLRTQRPFKLPCFLVTTLTLSLARALVRALARRIACLLATRRTDR